MMTRRAALYGAAIICALVSQIVHAQVEDVSRNLDSRGAILAFASVGGGDTVLTSTSSGQLFRSTDMGWTWTLLSTGTVADAHTCFHRHGDVLFAGTRGGDILRSVTAGESWTPVYRFPGKSGVMTFFADAHGFLAVAEDGSIASRPLGDDRWEHISTAPSIRCAAIVRICDSILVVGSLGDGILISTDAGASWGGPSVLPYSTMICDVEVCPCGGLLAATYNSCLHHSSDRGQSWEPEKTRPYDEQIRQICIWKDSLVLRTEEYGVSFKAPHDRFSLPLNLGIAQPLRTSFVLANDNLLIGDSLGSVYRTIVPPTSEDSADIVSLHQGLARPVLAPGEHIDFKASIRRYCNWRSRVVSGTVVVRNTLSGLEFRRALGEDHSENEPFRVDVPWDAEEGEYALIFRVADSPFDRGIESRQFFTVKAREVSEHLRCVYRSDSTYTFQLLHGTPNEELYCAEGDGRLLQSTDCGETWKNILPSRYSGQIVREVRGSSHGVLLAILEDFTPIISRDGGMQWDEMRALPGETHAIEIQGQRMLALSDGNIHFSRDTGNTWKEITPIYGITYSTLLLGPDDDIILTSSQGILRTTDEGQSWKTIRSPHGRHSVLKLFQTANGDLYLPFGYALYQSTDCGKSWTVKLQREMKLGSIHDLCETENGDLFARHASMNPVVIRKANSAFWENDIAVPDSLWKNLRKIVALGNTIAAATSHGVLYIRPAAETSSVRQRQCVPSMLRIASTHPNPCVANASIVVESEYPQHCRLQVLDMLGRCVATLHEGVLPEGRSTFRFEGSGLPAGSYLVILRSGRSVQTHKMVLVR